MKLGYRFQNPGLIKQVMQETMIASRQLLKENPSDPTTALVGLTPGAAATIRGCELDVELEGKEEVVQSVMARIVENLENEGWIKTT